MHTWIRLIPAVLLILPLTTARLRADGELPTKADVKNLSDKVDRLLSDMTANSLRGNATVAELRAIHDELQRIRQLLEIMAQQPGPIQRQAFYGPSPVMPPAAAPTTGTVTVQNTHPAPATVVINGQAYPVEPYQTRSIILPAGSFQYSVEVAGFGLVEPLRSETLRPAGGYRINIFPR
jgi:hypothetical protein